MAELLRSLANFEEISSNLPQEHHFFIPWTEIPFSYTANLLAQANGRAIHRTHGHRGKQRSTKLNFLVENRLEIAKPKERRKRAIGSRSTGLITVKLLRRPISSYLSQFCPYFWLRLFSINFFREILLCPLWIGLCSLWLYFSILFIGNSPVHIVLKPSLVVLFTFTVPYGF